MAIPTLRQLQFLTALGDTGSFSRAAEACYVTQPTLSAGIKELEELLGVRLADREAHMARGAVGPSHHEILTSGDGDAARARRFHETVRAPRVGQLKPHIKGG